MLKSLRNLSDEEVVVFWSENPGLPGADADLATRMKHRTTTVAGLIEPNQANRPEIKNRETRKPNFQNFRNGNPEISNDRAPTGCEK
jgi:hypothetical protein